MATIDKFLTFKRRNKFSAEVWIERGLNPSNDAICKHLTDFFDSCTDKVISGINNKLSNEQIKHLLEKELVNLNRSDFDTEEREFICDLFFELASYINIYVNDLLGMWMYGFIPERKKRKIIEIIKQPCTRCEIELETFVEEKEEGIPEEGWRLAKCNNCGELNLLSCGKNIKRASFGNYQGLGMLKMDKYNYEQALARLEQIKLLKKIEYKGSW